MTQTKYPKIDLTTFILSISSNAFLHLGVTSNNLAQAAVVDLDVARQNLDLLELIADKTKGNRTQDEERLMNEMITQLTARFKELGGSR